MIHKPSLESLDVPQKILGLIGSVVLTFIGYKQTNRQTPRQTDKPNLYIDIDATDRSKISCDQKRFFIALSLYTHFHFSRPLPLK